MVVIVGRIIFLFLGFRPRPTSHIRKSWTWDSDDSDLIDTPWPKFIIGETNGTDYRVWKYANETKDLKNHMMPITGIEITALLILGAMIDLIIESVSWVLSKHQAIGSTGFLFTVATMVVWLLLKRSPVGKHLKIPRWPVSKKLVKITVPKKSSAQPVLTYVQRQLTKPEVINPKKMQVLNLRVSYHVLKTKVCRPFAR